MHGVEINQDTVTEAARLLAVSSVDLSSPLRPGSAESFGGPLVSQIEQFWYELNTCNRRLSQGHSELAEYALELLGDYEQLDRSLATEIDSVKSLMPTSQEMR